MLFDPKPQFEKVARTQAVFQDSTITYNEPGYTYNELGGVYGGSDRTQDAGPNMDNVINSIPQG